MPLYRYNGNSLIDEARFIKNATGGVRAYLHAREGATAEELRGVVSKLAETGCVVVPTELNGRQMLEVRGFSKNEDLRATLGEIGGVSGLPFMEKLAEDQVSIKEWFRSKSLYLVSLLYLGGDVGFIAYENMQAKEKEGAPKQGTKKGRALEEPKKWLDFDKIMGRVGGLGYLAGSTTSLLSLLMKQDSTQEDLRNAASVSIKALQNSGVTLQADDPLALAAGKTNDIGWLRKTFTQHPSELMNLSFATAGTGISYTAYKDHQKDLKAEKENPALRNSKVHNVHKLVHKLDIGLGLGTFASGMLGTFLKEKAPDPDKPRRKGLGGVVDWFKEKPLRISGYGYIISTFIHLISSIMERWAIVEDNKTKKPKDRKDLKGTGARLFFVITNFAAELILAFSSKGHGDGVKADASVNGTIVGMVAQTILKAPLERREELIGKMSATLARHDVLSIKKEAAEKLLRDQLAGFEKNPWAQALALQAPVIAAVPPPEKDLAQAVSDTAPAPEAARETPAKKGFADKESAFTDWKAAAAISADSAASVGATVH